MLAGVFVEGVVLVDREVLAVSPRAGSKVAVLPLRPVKYNPCDLRIQTHVAARSLNTVLHVFEATVQLPKFAAFRYLEDASAFRNPSSR